MKTIEITGENYSGSWDKSRTACRGIVMKGTLILLSYETQTDLYMIPGGGMEDGEDEAACCVRGGRGRNRVRHKAFVLCA